MTLFSILVGVTIFIIFMVFMDWLYKHPAHKICKELPPRTEHCKHDRFVMDKQIRAIECKQCGMRSWLEKEHVDLFANDLTSPKNK